MRWTYHQIMICVVLFCSCVGHGHQGHYVQQVQNDGVGVCDGDGVVEGESSECFLNEEERLLWESLLPEYVYEGEYDGSFSKRLIPCRGDSSARILFLGEWDIVDGYIGSSVYEFLDDVYHMEGEGIIGIENMLHNVDGRSYLIVYVNNN